jgi:esterase/lipase superfamily enzyme
MVETLAPLIRGGKLKLYCTESNVAEAWTRRESDPHWRLQRHKAYERYVLEELVPYVRGDCRTADIPIAASGTSLGALYAANFALKHPTIFQYALCMSGRYDIGDFANGYTGQDLYFNNPMAYVPNVNGSYLESLRATHLTLVCGQGKWEDGNVEETLRFGRVLAAKQIPHEVDIWGHDSAHEWAWWRRQADTHLRRRFV